MMDNKETNNAFENLDEFTEKYKHYASEESENVSETEIQNENYSEENEIASGDIIDAEPQDEDVFKNDSSTVKKKKGNFFTRNKYRNTKIIALCLVIAMLLGAGGVLVWFYLTTKDGTYADDGIDYGTIDKDYLVDDDTQFEVMGDIDADSLNAFLYEWANNGGEKMYNKNVINVLLCGVDSEYNLCDSQILVSIDKKNEKITMVSFLRDSWTYIRMPNEDGTYYDEYEKINAAYHGGPTTLKETLENNYKIKIDQYICVDFQSFPKVIDALGGVTVDVQEYEASYIRRTSSQTDFPSGTATLTGKQALIYSRIRHCDDDSDLSRTRRQRTVIKALISKAKTATNGQLVNAFKQVSGYLRTGYSQTEVLSLIATAYSHKWMDFEIEEYVMPNEDYVERIGGYVNSTTWAWTVDYPLCAQRLQNILYGKTNIVLSDDRVSALDFVSNKRNTTASDSSSSYSSSSGSSSSSENSNGSGGYYNNSSNSSGSSYTTSSSVEEEPDTEPATEYEDPVIEGNDQPIVPDDEQE